jgi:hypothetical protein
MTNEINIVELNNNILTVEVTAPGPQGIAGDTETIGDVKDVLITAPLNDDAILMYNSSNQKWENVNILDGGTP